jgi:hypothetical protein
VRDTLEKNVASRKVSFEETSHFLELLDKPLVSYTYLGEYAMAPKFRTMRKAGESLPETIFRVFLCWCGVPHLPVSTTEKDGKFHRLGKWWR